VLTALLGIPLFYGSSHTTASRSQDVGQSDVKPKTKDSQPIPAFVTAAAPANDNCANAISIESCPFTDTRDTTGATDETGEPASPCTAQEKSVWYTLPASVNRRIVTVDTCGSSYDTAIVVWQVTGAACAFAGFVPIACNDDGAVCDVGLQSTVLFTALGGQTYKIQAGGFSGGAGSLVVNVVCQEIVCDDVVVHGAIGSGDPNFQGVQSSTNQTGRLNRNGISSTCAAPKTCLVFTAVGARPADVYQIPNTSGQAACVNVNLNVTDATGCNLQSNAYLNSFNPANICTNYLADPGLSSGIPPVPTNFSFTVPAGQTLVLVVHPIDPGSGTGCHYTMTVSGNLCTPFDVCLQDDSNPGIVFQANSQTGAYRFCCGGSIFTGFAMVTSHGSIITFQHYAGDRRVLAKYDGAVFKGTASVQAPPGTTKCTIGDRNTTNNSCVCQ
jgi:hypothetical protein